MELSAKPTSATTSLLSLCYRNNLARSEGFEPPTPRFEVWFSRTQPDLAGLLAFRKPYFYGSFRPVKFGPVPLQSSILRPRCVPSPTTLVLRE